MINYIKRLEIKKDQIDLINQNITIGELIIDGVCYKKEDYYVITDKNFYIENVDFFIKLKNSQQCLNAIISFDDKIIKDRVMLAKLIDIISNDKDLNVLVGLLNYSFAFQKKYNNTLINDSETLIKYQIIIDSKDPIVYLRSAKYIFGKRWLENSYVYDPNDRKKIEEIILDNINKYKETNSNNRNEKLAYLQLLGYYVDKLINSRWKEFEEKILYNNDYLFINYVRKFFKNRDENIENILLKLNMTHLFFYYFTNILKEKPWEDFRGIIKDEVIDAAIASIEGDDNSAIEYSLTIKKRLSYEIEERIINNFISYMLGDPENFIVFFVGLYYYINIMVKEKFPLFEKLLLKIDDFLNHINVLDSIRDRKFLNEIAFYYIVINCNGIWEDFGVKNKKDLDELKQKVIKDIRYIGNLNIRNNLEELRQKYLYN